MPRVDSGPILNETFDYVEVTISSCPMKSRESILKSVLPTLQKLRKFCVCQIFTWNQVWYFFYIYVYILRAAYNSFYVKMMHWFAQKGDFFFREINLPFSRENKSHCSLQHSAHCTVGNLRKFTLTFFRQKFREIIVSSKQVTKQLVWRNIFSVTRFSTLWVWKNKYFSLALTKFREINSLVTPFVKMLLSRNFWPQVPYCVIWKLSRKSLLLLEK